MAGNATVAYVTETNYNSGVSGTPTYRLPGSGLTIDTVELSNDLSRVRNPQSVVPDRSVAQALEGSLSVTFNLTDNTFNTDLLFDGTDGSGNDTFSSGHVPSAEWYLGLDYADSVSSVSTVERQIQGWVCTDMTVDYTTGDLARVTLSGPYATETKNTSATPGTISGGGEETDFHEVTFTIDGSTLYSDSVNSAEIAITNLARLVRGTDREPADAIRAAPEAELTIDADIRTGDSLAYAYDGTTGATTPGTSLTAISGNVAFAPNGATVTTYEFGELKVLNYDWDSLVDGEATAAEPVTFHADSTIKQTS